MAQPTAYDPAHEFLTDEALNTAFPGSELDIEFGALQQTIDEILTNLALIQRDDGLLANGVVTYDSLSEELQSNGLAPADAWLTATAYAVGDAVIEGGSLYRCLVAHTSGTFATDLAAAYWDLIVALPTGPAGTDGTDGLDGTNGIDGADGSLIFVQDSAPSTSNPAGSIWIDADSTDQDLYQLSGGVWTDTGVNVKGSDGTLTASGTPTVGQLGIWTNSTTQKGVSITGLVKGNGASDPTAAVSGTDYAPATSGTSMLKGNGSGGFSNAVSGTDYLAPAAIGSTVQGYDADLAAIAALTSAADKIAYSTGAGTWALTDFTSVARQLLDDTTTAAMLVTLGAAGQGKQTCYIPAGAMVARTTNGAAAGTAETTTNKVMIKTLDFDTATQEFAQFAVWFPKSWNVSTVTFQAEWSHASTSTNFGVVWALEGLALSDDDAMDTAFGTAQQVADTGGTTNDKYTTSESSAITIGNTPAAGDVVIFQVKRVPSDGSDTMAIDARLHGIRLFYTTNAATDA